ncbi:MAG: M28 family peptidase [Fimbriimonadaceae bacterium]|nr:M28 family peptidase [Fimbriimonadaceae bacterium]
MRQVAGMAVTDAGAGRRIRRGLAALLLGGGALLWAMLAMPGRSYRGPLPPASAAQQQLAAELRRDLAVLADEIGERHVFERHGLRRAERWLSSQLRAAGYRVERQEHTTSGEPVANLIAALPGTRRPAEMVVVGAHYDSVECPGANDNGSGAVAVLALARRFAARPGGRTLRLVEFVNEEPPFFWTDQMGSRVYARACRRRGDRIVAMLSLETLGYYTDAPDTQRYPLPLLGEFYPSEGNFVAWIGHLRHKRLLRHCLGTFRATTPFPSEGLAAASAVPGIGWSDHWAFWQEGYPAVLVTDSAVYRDPHYHQRSDTVEHLDYDRFARVVEGVERVVRDLLDRPD